MKQKEMPVRPLHTQHIGLGVFFAVLSAFFLTLMSILVKEVDKYAIPIKMMLFARFSISLILTLPWVIKNPQEITNSPYAK